MKKVLLTIGLVYGLALNALAGGFADGFRAGYIAAYKQAQVGMEPIVPITPLIPVGVRDTYQAGFIIGAQEAANAD
jgi:hypothetical protein